MGEHSLKRGGSEQSSRGGQAAEGGILITWGVYCGYGEFFNQGGNLIIQQFYKYNIKLSFTNGIIFAFLFIKIISITEKSRR